MAGITPTVMPQPHTIRLGCMGPKAYIQNNPD